MIKNAAFSPCGRYRYTLSRQWSPDDQRAQALWIMLNPSTADAIADDPTIRRCIRFSQAWGCAGLTVINLFAHRSASPDVLLRAPEPVGPENDRYIAEAIAAHRRRQDLIILAWGAKAARPKLRLRRNAVLRQVPVEEAMCLRVVGSGDPGHPLYVTSTLGPVQYEFPAEAI